jgi:nucleotide-binding universal stress UspA family protein
MAVLDRNSRLVKSILALVGGGDRDEIILQTALAAAIPLVARLEFLHVHVSSEQAARYSRHADFAMGVALRNTMDQLEKEANVSSDLAANHVRDFCARSMIELCDTPTETKKVTARFREVKDNAVERLTFHARHHDLIVMGRGKQTRGLPPDILERLVLSCGRPVLVAGSPVPQKLTGTIMVCWKESSNAARAVTAATPLLIKAKRVIITSVVERDDGVTEAAHDLAKQFAWNGIPTEVNVIPRNDRGIASSLSDAAEACGADLMVLGAYGHLRVHELLFGSCTEAFIRQADRPILLVH